MKKHLSTIIRYAVLLLVAMIWGFAFVAQNKVNTYFAPFSVVCLRSAAAALFLFPVAAARDRLTGSERHLFSVRDGRLHLDITKTEWIGGALCGLALGTAATLQQFGLLYNDSAGKTAFLSSLYVVFVPILGLFLGKKTPPLIFCGVLGAVVGGVLLTLPPDGGDMSLSRGDMLVLACTVAYAVHILIIDRFSPRTDGVRLSAVQFLVCTLVTLPALFLENQPGAFADGLLYILYLGIGSSGIGYTLQILVQKNTHPVAASVILSLESVFGLLGGILISGETHTAREYIGAGVILLSVIVSGLGGVGRGDVQAAAGGVPESDDTNRQDDKNCT